MMARREIPQLAAGSIPPRIFSSKQGQQPEDPGTERVEKHNGHLLHLLLCFVVGRARPSSWVTGSGTLLSAMLFGTANVA